MIYYNSVAKGTVMVAMVTFIFLLFMLLFQAGMIEVKAAGNSYYVDSIGGNDHNNGSQAAPWKTLSKVNGTNFQPGDTIYLKAGSVFYESLKPGCSGASGNPVRFDMYGTGNKPVIDVSGVADPDISGVAAVNVQNKEFLEFYNLDITNNPTDPSLKYRVGILLSNRSYGSNLHGIVIKNCNIHDIALNTTYADDPRQYPMGGIGIFTCGANSAFDGITIDSVNMLSVANAGIYAVNYDWWNKNWNPNGTTAARSSNIIVRNVSVTDSKGNGIAIGHADGTLIESCTVNGFAKYNDNFVGIWIHNTDRSTIQYCESSGGVVSGYDSEGFDLDLRVTNSKIQYCYSHDNAGGFLLNCVSGNSGNIVRYNISQNDKVVLFKALPPGDSYYNNTAYIAPGLTTKVWGIAGASGYFCNNIIESHGTTLYKDPSTVVSGTHDNNCYYGVTSPDSEPHAITSNPQFANPGTGGNGLYTCNGYMLKDTSPCRNAGTNVTDNGGSDFFGNPLLHYDLYTDIGAYEFNSGSNLKTEYFYKVDGTTMTDITATGLTNGSVFTRKTLSNNAQNAQDVSIIIALYDKTTNALVNMKIKHDWLAGRQTKLVSSEMLTVPVNYKNYKIKVFYWNDIGKLVPFSTPGELY